MEYDREQRTGENKDISLDTLLRFTSQSLSRVSVDTRGRGLALLTCVHRLSQLN